MHLLNKWSLERDADPLAGSEQSFERWRIRFENLSGPRVAEPKWAAPRRLEVEGRPFRVDLE